MTVNIKCRKISRGKAQGEVILSNNPLSFLVVLTLKLEML